MFTGIIQAVLPVIGLEKKTGLISLTLEPDIRHLKDLAQGASIAINGVCLTATEISDTSVRFDIIQETLDCSTLQYLEVGSLVNFERSLQFGSEIGGHIISGHVDTTAELVNIEQKENNCGLTFQYDPKWSKYILPKGFIGLHGASLTVVDPGPDTLTVWLIPETLEQTNLSSMVVGDRVNIEIDRQTQAIVDTVERVLATQTPK